MIVDEAERGPWFEIALVVASRDADACTGVLADLGLVGTELIEHEESSTEIRVHVRALGLPAAKARALALERELPMPLLRRATVRELDDRLWLEDWKRHFARKHIGRHLVIVPPWESIELENEEDIVIVINPGMAFGTGGHETTAACLELLERILTPGAAVLDVGCGSAILAVAAAKMGAKRVVAVDHDPVAVNAARENIVLNQVTDRVDVRLCDGPPVEKNLSYDVVLANILAEPLVKMAKALTSCVTEYGKIVVSGIESQRRALVEVAFDRLGWSVTTDLERSGWVSLALARRSGDGEQGQ